MIYKPKTKVLKILIAGASGFVGKALKEELQKNGHEVFTLVRDQKLVSSHAFFWDPAHFQLPKDLTPYENLDACINLSGENISSGRWTKLKKEKILKSRLDATHALVALFSSVKSPPSLFINASAIGFYGERGGEILTENSSPGRNFLADVCTKWEKAAAPLEKLPVRMIYLRIAPVLAKTGGALSKMLLPFKLGLGGKLGSGEQYFSFISLKDLIRIVLFILKEEQIEGVVNAASPYPLRNKDFTKILAKSLHRPAFFTVPAFAARLLLGQMADELLLVSARAYPKKLIDNNFYFEYPTAQSIFNDCLN
ncbi:MAG TPA: TIGR01777 family oxidoreductase [Parachlamydiaceae bacterium]|nr:TIGR01777 family oxidoreductase [Parachlamydiaceae bacterium]